MLERLHIRNYALISELDIDFGAGFSVLTGETGAGKSIILGALNLVMGGRADTKAITEGEERCVIEAVFSRETDSKGERRKAKDGNKEDGDGDGYIYGDGDGDGDGDGEIIVRRELNRSGRSRSFVNDEVVTQAELKELSGRLLDIHSQNENLLLGDDNFQLQITDMLAKNTAEREAYRAAYTAWRESEKELRELEALAAKSRKDQDYTAFQYKQLEEAQISDEDEIQQLEAEEYRLSHVEQLQAALQTALQALDGDEGGAIHLVRQAEEAMGDDEELGSRLGSAEIELKDIAAEISRQADMTEADPERLQTVQERLEMLSGLMRKHGVQTLQELKELRDQWAELLQRIDSFDAETEEKKKETEALFRKADKAAQALSKSREAVLKPAAKQLTKDLAELGVVHAHVEMEMTEAEEYTETGHDKVELLFAANLNQSPRRVSEVASGGETSRLMLCIKALTATENGLQTLIFDEIDTGVSGAVAAKTGRIMQEMGKHRQVIAITHLPQTAACGNAHYKVYKQDTDKRTETHIRRLNEEERVGEIAAMLAGDKVSEASTAAARQLIEQQRSR